MPESAANRSSQSIRKIEPGLIVAIMIGCVVGAFVVHYAAKAIPNRPVGGLVANVAGDIAVDEKPIHIFSVTGDVHGIGFTSDGNGLFVGDREGLTLRSAATGQVLRTFDTEQNGIRSLAISPNGTLIAATLVYGGDVRLYPTDTTAETVSPAMILRDGGDQEQQAVAFAPDGNTLCGGGFDKTLRIWQADGIAPSGAGKVFDTTVGTGKSGRLLQKAVKLGDTINAVAFMPDGKNIAVATGPKVTLIEMATGKTNATFYSDKQTVTAITISPDGKILVIGSADGNIILFEVATGRKVATIKPTVGGDTDRNASALHVSGLNHGVATLIYTPDGKQLIAALRSGIVQISEGATGKVQKLLADPGNDRPAQSLALSPDGKTSAVSYSDGTVRLWKL